MRWVLDWHARKGAQKSVVTPCLASMCVNKKIRLKPGTQMRIGLPQIMLRRISRKYSLLLIEVVMGNEAASCFAGALGRM